MGSIRPTRKRGGATQRLQGRPHASRTRIHINQLDPPGADLSLPGGNLLVVQPAGSLTSGLKVAVRVWLGYC